MIASRSRAMTLLGLAFVLGLIVGGGVVVQAVRSGNAGWAWRGHSGGRPGAGSYGASLDRKLHLNLEPAKRDSITAIACRGLAAMDSLRTPLRQPMDSLFQTIRPVVELRRAQARTEIRSLLTPPQRERYDSMNRADDEQRKKMRDQGGSSLNGGGGGPCSGSPGGSGPRGGFDRGSR